MQILKHFFLMVMLSFAFISSRSQIIYNSQLLGSQKPFELSVPFLTITPDARAGGMGDCGIATSTDVNAMHCNAAKYAFADALISLGPP